MRLPSSPQKITSAPCAGTPWSACACGREPQSAAFQRSDFSARSGGALRGTSRTTGERSQTLHHRRHWDRRSLSRRPAPAAFSSPADVSSRPRANGVIWWRKSTRTIGTTIVSFWLLKASRTPSTANVRPRLFAVIAEGIHGVRHKDGRSFSRPQEVALCVTGRTDSRVYTEVVVAQAPFWI